MRPLDRQSSYRQVLAAAAGIAGELGHINVSTLHLAAALYHAWVRRDGVFGQMARGERVR